MTTKIFLILAFFMTFSTQAFSAQRVPGLKSQNLETRYWMPPQKELRRWEFRTAPAPLLIQWYTLDVSFRLNEKFATGPSAIVYGGSGRGSMFFPSYRGYAAGWNGTFYFQSVLRRTWYLSSHAYYEDYEHAGHGAVWTSEYKGVRANLVGGYQWVFGRMTMMVGAGAEYRVHNVVERDRYYLDDSLNLRNRDSSFRESRLFPALEFKLGIEI